MRRKPEQIQRPAKQKAGLLQLPLMMNRTPLTWHGRLNTHRGGDKAFDWPFYHIDTGQAKNPQPISLFCLQSGFLFIIFSIWLVAKKIITHLVNKNELFMCDSFNRLLGHLE